MNLHIVFVLVYSVCLSVIQSVTYLLRVIILDVTKRRGESERTSERRHQRPLVDTIVSEKKNKTGISGCGSFVVAYSPPATSIERLQYHYEIFENLVATIAKMHQVGV